MADAKPVEFEGGELTASGEALLRFRGVEGAFDLAVPAKASLPPLLSVVADLLARSGKAAGANPQEKLVFEAASWSVHTAPDRLVLAFNLPNGAELSFAVPASQGSALMDAIAKATTAG